MTEQKTANKREAEKERGWDDSDSTKASDGHLDTPDGHAADKKSRVDNFVNNQDEYHRPHVEVIRQSNTVWAFQAALRT